MRARPHHAPGTSAPLAAAAPGRLGLALAASLMLVATVACRPPADRTAAAATGTDVVVRVLDEPTTVGPATVEVEVRRPQGPVEAAGVTITGDMTHAGMVPVIDPAEEVGGGRYRTQTFRFTMAGDWVLTVDVVLPDGERRQSAIDVRVQPRP